MKANLVLPERTFRMGLGLLLLASPLLELPTYPYNLLGLVLIATAIIGSCPVYGLLSLATPRRRATARVHHHRPSRAT